MHTDDTMPEAKPRRLARENVGEELIELGCRVEAFAHLDGTEEELRACIDTRHNYTVVTYTSCRACKLKSLCMCYRVSAEWGIHFCKHWIMCQMQSTTYEQTTQS